MRLVKRFVQLLALCGALGLAACGGDDDSADDGSDADDGASDGVDPAGEDHTYVVDSIDVPSNSNEAGELGLDLDGNGQPDNNLGGKLGLVASAVDLTAEVNAQLAAGGIILLANLKATSLTNASGVGLSVYLGANPDPAPCTDDADPETCGQHLQGDGSFEIDPASPDDALIVGENSNGRFEGGPGQATLQLSIAGTTLGINLIAAHAEVSVAEDGLSSGKLGGAVTQEEFDETVIPVVAQLISGLVAACEGGDEPCGCDGGTETARGLFDDNDDCMVSAEEVSMSEIGALLRTADLDLLDASGEAGTDGTNDSISLGVGFSAVSGSFTPP